MKSLFVLVLLASFASVAPLRRMYAAEGDYSGDVDQVPPNDNSYKGNNGNYETNVDKYDNGGAGAGGDKYNSGGKPGYDAGKPGYDGGKPGYDGGKPGYDGGKPGYDDGKPGYDGGKPGYDAGKPGYDGGKPGYDGGKPGYDGGKPGYDGGKPGYDGGKPGYDGGKPGYDGGKPGYGGGKPDQGRKCPDPFPRDGKYKLEHLDNRKLFSFCTGGCIKRDNKVYRPALKSVVSKELRDSREWYNLWNVNKSGGNRIKLTVGDVGSLRAEKGKYSEDVAVFVDKRGADQLWTVTVHPDKDCTITLHNDAGQYVKRATKGRFTVLRPEYFSPEVAGPRPNDDTCYFHVIPDQPSY